MEKAVRRRRAAFESATLADFFWTIAGLEPEDVRIGIARSVGARCWRLAAYVLTVELLVPNADLARALGQSRQNIKQGRDIIELRRDDPALTGQAEISKR